MPYLDSFTEDQKRLLIALPYRAGLWISESDLTGGNEARDAELASLEAIITGFATDMCKSEFVEELLRETVAQKDRWTGWQENLDTVPAECTRAADTMAAHYTRKEVDAFVQAIMEIARTVAIAYKEYDTDAMGFGETVSLYIRFLRERINARMRGRPARPFSHLLSVSQREEKALKELAGALNGYAQDGTLKQAV